MINYFVQEEKIILYNIICVEPVQILQKVKLVNEASLCNISCVSMSNKGFLFASYGENLIQFKIINDEKNNFIELEIYDRNNKYNSQSQAFINTKDDKLFYLTNGNKMIFCLQPFKN